jgi:hypothetical protein
MKNYPKRTYRNVLWINPNTYCYILSDNVEAYSIASLRMMYINQGYVYIGNYDTFGAAFKSAREHGSIAEVQLEVDNIEQTYGRMI